MNTRTGKHSKLILKSIGLLALMTTACTSAPTPEGSTTNGIGEDPNVPRQQPAPESILSGYQLADAACQTRTNTSSLSNQGIASTWYGLHQVQQCQISGDSLACSKAYRTVQAASPLRICDQARTFPSQSLEGIAIASARNIDLARKFYGNIASARANLVRTALVVMPQIEKVYTTTSEGRPQLKRQLVGNNLAYSSNLGGQPAFIVYPTVQSESRSQRPDLWRSSWAIAHEYGHHIFGSHAVVSNDLVTLEDHADEFHSGKFHAEHAEELSFAAQSTGGGRRNVGAIDHWQAVNEGFADLFAFYSLGRRPGLSAGLPCLSTSRDTVSPVFGTGHRKVLDNQALSAFYASTHFPSAGCDGPNFQGPHSVGAVIAFGMNKIFTASQRTESGRKMKPSELLLRWSNRIGKLRARGTSHINLPELIGAGVRTAAAAGNNGWKVLNRQQCAGIDQVFPLWKHDLLRIASAYCK